MNPCSGCGNTHNRIGQRYCLDCHAAYMREWRIGRSLKGPARERAICRAIAGVYKRRGLLVPGPCAHCGAAKTEKHHPDYSRPLLVVWLCRPCHLALHNEKSRETVREAA